MNLEDHVRAALAREADDVHAVRPIPARTVRRVKVRRAIVAAGALGTAAALLIGGLTLAQPDLSRDDIRPAPAPTDGAPDVMALLRAAEIDMGDRTEWVLAKVDEDEICALTTLPNSVVACGGAAETIVAEAEQAGGDVVVYGFAAHETVRVAAWGDSEEILDLIEVEPPPDVLNTDVRFFGFVTSSTVRGVTAVDADDNILGVTAVNVSGPTTAEVTGGSTRGEAWMLWAYPGPERTLCLELAYARDMDRVCSPNDAAIVAREVFGRNRYVYGSVPPGTARAVLVREDDEFPLKLFPRPEGVQFQGRLFASSSEGDSTRAVVAYDADGNVLARRELNLTPPEPSRPPQLSVASGSHEGRRWLLSTEVSTDRVCAHLFFEEAGGAGGACVPVEQQASAAVSAGPPGVIFGTVTRAAGTVEIVLDGGPPQAAAVYTGLPGFSFDLYVAFVDPDRGGRVLVRDGNGEVLYEEAFCRPKSSEICLVMFPDRG